MNYNKKKKCFYLKKCSLLLILFAFTNITIIKIQKGTNIFYTNAFTSSIIMHSHIYQQQHEVRGCRTSTRYITAIQLQSNAVAPHGNAVQSPAVGTTTGSRWFQPCTGDSSPLRFTARVSVYVLFLLTCP